MCCFDEATSALDNETEQAVMGVFEDLGEEITILTSINNLERM
jgi:ABC-type transport system involved in cytochrome bd biosynthesis fused ATPase/permease subunit